MSQLGEKVNKLLRGVKNGEKFSFKKLHETTYNHLTIVALNYLYNPDDLDDVLNESYLRMFKYINSYDNSRDGYNWMCKIVQNVAYQYNSRHNIFVELNKAELHGLFYEIDENIIDNVELLIVIKNLDAETQELLYLKYWEDLSFSEIASKKGMKKPTVYKKINVALKIIRKFLSKR